MNFSLSDDAPSLIVPCRLNVFGARLVRGRRRPKLTELKRVECGWQGWNPDPAMEDRMARLPGSGSFYWPSAIRALVAAKALCKADPTITQVAIETISGRPIGRLYRRAA